MTDLMGLQNKGILTLGIREKTNAPIVVVGTARGGTSMMAGALNQLGIFFGDSAYPPVYEDLLLSNAFEDNDLEEVAKIVGRYNKAQKIWAWKRPSSVNYLRDVHRSLVNPSYIFVFRDILSTANRNLLPMNTDIFPSLMHALNDYNLALEFLTDTDVHALLVSYEKAIQYPEFLIDEIITSFDLSASPNQRIKAIDFIRPSKSEYVLNTTIKIPHDFDPDAYLKLNPDVKNAGVDPVRHYIDFGFKEGRSYKKTSPN